MSSVATDLVTLIVRELRSLEREIEMFPDDESLWQVRPGVTNSAGNLALHLSGNLQHFVGAVIGKTGYVRDRDAEFSRKSGSRADVVAELRKTANIVASVLPSVTDSQLGDEYPEPVAGVTLPTRIALMHLASHAAFHLGQASYLRRIITGDTKSSGPMPISDLRRT